MLTRDKMIVTWSHQKNYFKIIENFDQKGWVQEETVNFFAVLESRQSAARSKASIKDEVIISKMFNGKTYYAAIVLAPTIMYKPGKRDVLEGHQIIEKNLVSPPAVDHEFTSQLI